MNYLFFFLAFLVGIANTVQSGVNSQLRIAVQNPILASIISFLIGLTALLICYALFNKAPVPSLENFRNIVWWKWIGGLLGAFYVLSVIFSVKEIGPANLLSLLIAGQLLAGIVVDHFGWIGLMFILSIFGVSWHWAYYGGVWLVLKISIFTLGFKSNF
ncbi:MAG: DMT family transporter [Spirosomataceae bacterium]